MNGVSRWHFAAEDCVWVWVAFFLITSRFSWCDRDSFYFRNLGNGAASTQNAGSLPSLPDYFSGRKFYIFSKEFDVKEEETVCRLIIAFKGYVLSWYHLHFRFYSAFSVRGFCSLSMSAFSVSRTVEPHMSTDVEFVVSRAAWCNDFDEVSLLHW